jgi:hypothetical protein
MRSIEPPSLNVSDPGALLGGWIYGLIPGKFFPARPERLREKNILPLCRTGFRDTDHEPIFFGVTDTTRIPRAMTGTGRGRLGRTAAGNFMPPPARRGDARSVCEPAMRVVGADGACATEDPPPQPGGVSRQTRGALCAHADNPERNSCCACDFSGHGFHARHDGVPLRCLIPPH